MLESSTAGVQRALNRAEARAHRRGAAAIEPVDLLAALVDESESQAAEILNGFGLDPSIVLASIGAKAWEPSVEDLELAEPLPIDRLPISASLRTALTAASSRAHAVDRGRPVGTEHLLTGLVTTNRPIAEALASAGLPPDAITRQLEESTEAEAAPLPFPKGIAPLNLGESAREVDLDRILDASANRAREGLRVVEDYARFVLDDSGLTRRLKEVRHRLAEALSGLDLDHLIAARDTRGDVGTHIMTAAEQTRENPRAILSANFKRTAEALRSLEEYAKLVDVWLAGRFEVLRYDVYTLEKLTLTAAASARVLGTSRLMVLLGGEPTLGTLTWLVNEALAGGADVIQLREKNVTDREWLRRAREVRILTARAGARFIVNDRPDLARLASADAVHLGQDDVSVRDARRIVGPAMLIGVSTHDRGQIDQAVLSGAGYLGVGPIFASQTKDFDNLAGLAHVRAATELTNLPWFAIGGINAENLDDVLSAGASRIAVSSSITRAASPRLAASALRSRLDAAWADEA